MIRVVPREEERDLTLKKKDNVITSAERERDLKILH